jgi:hypothetical protein
MFDHQHYVPVMRMKPAELRALRNLEPTLRSVTTPILECPPRLLRACDTPSKLERRADWFIEHLAEWRGRLDVARVAEQAGYVAAGRTEAPGVMIAWIDRID